MESQLINIYKQINPISGQREMWLIFIHPLWKNISALSTKMLLTQWGNALAAIWRGQKKATLISPSSTPTFLKLALKPSANFLLIWKYKKIGKILIGKVASTIYRAEELR